MPYNFPNDTFEQKCVFVINIYSSAWVMCKQVKYDKNMMTNTLTHMKFYNIFCVGQLSMWKFQNNAQFLFTFQLIIAQPNLNLNHR